MFFNQYPYINVNDLNLDFILKAIKEMQNEVANFVSINAVKYANPIQWNITSQYEKNTIVIDPQTGTAYISVAPVPSGVALTRDEYWTVVFDLGAFVTRSAKNFTSRYEADTTLTATFNSAVGDWLVWGDTLYVAKVNITAGDSYVIDSNIEHITIEEVKNAILQTISNNYNAIIAMIGNLNDLTTTAKNNIVAAINELVSADAAINRQIQTLRPYIFNKRGIVFISDSFGNFSVGSKNMMELAAEYLGVSDYYVSWANGAGFIVGTSTFTDLLMGVPTLNYEVTDVVVLGGTNDHNQSSNDILAAMGTFVTNAKTKYPLAKIWIGCTGGPSYKNDSVNGPMQTINNIYPAYLNCIKVGAYPLNNLISALHGNVYKLSDNTHPDNDGVVILAKSIAECLSGGRCHNNYLVVNDSTNTTAENGGQLYTNTIFQSLNDDYVTVGGNGPTSIGYSTPATFTGNTNIHLLTFNKFIAAPNIGFHAPTEVNFVVNGSANLQDADIFVDSNRLFLRTYLGTVSNVERIQFTMPQMIFPTMRC